MKSFSTTPTRGNGAQGPALLFLLTGLAALAVFSVVGWRSPSLILDAAAGRGVGPVFALLLVGWLSSMIFGLAYHVVPMLAGLPWWSRRLPWIHWALHVGGLGWMATVIAGWIPYAVTPGAVTVVVGLALFVANQQITAGRLSLWEPATITFAHALFWLVASAGLWLAVQFGQAELFTRADPEEVGALVLQLGVVGVVVLGLLGAALMLVPMFLVSPARPGALAWAGGLVLSVGLYALVVAGLGSLPGLQPWAGLCVAVGTLLYAFEILRLAWCGRRSWGWDFGVAAAGLLWLLVWLGWNLLGRPWEGASVAPTWTSLLLALLGPCAWMLLGLTARLAPLLTWTIAYASRVGREAVPSLSKLRCDAAAVPLAVVLALGTGYLIAGLVLQEKTGVVFAAANYLLAALWLVVGTAPGLRAVLAQPATRLPRPGRLHQPNDPLLGPPSPSARRP